MPNDLDLLQGSWSVAAVELEGQKMAAAMLANARIAIQGNRFTSTGVGAVYKGTLEIDQSARPRQIDMKFSAGPEKGNTNLGIYQLKGDTWKMCLATRGDVRPSKFASTPGSGFAVETLTRGGAPVIAKAKPRASKTARPAPATEFDGEWRMISGIMDGVAMEKSTVKWVKRVTQGNRTTVYAGPQVLMQFEFTTGPSNTIDYLNTAGSNKGKTQHGIYEFDGGLLKVCVSAPGAARPAQFESKPGDGRTLTVWKLAKSMAAEERQ